MASTKPASGAAIREEADPESATGRHYVQLKIGTDAATKEKIARAARISRQSLTDFAKTAALTRAEEMLARHEQILLSERDYALFAAIMTGESEPSRIAVEEAAEFLEGRTDGARYPC